MKVEADKLKSVAAGGTRTKVVALGIGDSVVRSELNNVASAPASRNVILAQDFSSLPDVENKLINASCSGQWFVIVSNFIVTT